MENYSIFELAGYTKEESEKLTEICNERGLDYSVMVSFLNSYDNSRDEVFKELIEFGKSPLEIAWADSSNQ